MHFILSDPQLQSLVFRIHNWIMFRSFSTLMIVYKNGERNGLSFQSEPVDNLPPPKLNRDYHKLFSSHRFHNQHSETRFNSKNLFAVSVVVMSRPITLRFASAKVTT
ncbi:hypothetical protein KC19_12G084400 [Ceratodon purpureus]|uniref:Uncharacterized protein n=1 Tax=Ceratodon purpureus TaxID=3225 RepID=A0A8T0G7I7_CERPU|nr:hypothetical protein KC19_12G083900 [Ceratodon purpureus]KAG0554354.1 hypothetical protein KC19_12G084400 [Ceratodon purpureus]